MVSEMILASFSKIWHLIPIVIAIILFRKFLNYKDKKRKILKNEEDEKNGLTLELRTKKKYEELGYKKVNQKNENQGVDLHMIKEGKNLLIQCQNSFTSKSITSKDIENFYDNATNYVKKNNIEEKNMELRYAIQYSDVLNKSAINILKDDSYCCKYIVV